jgi:transposase
VRSQNGRRQPGGTSLRRSSGYCVAPKGTGRPGYAPADLLKLYIYGYLNRVRSSRRLEAETHRNVEVIWLLRHLRPDFKTIADFRRDNCKAFRPIFRQFVLLCRQLDLFGRELIAVDGTRMKAVNNKDRNFNRASLAAFIRLADAKLDDYLQRLDHSDATEGRTGGSRVQNLAEKIAALRKRRTRCQAMLATLEQTGEDQISLTDPDSQAMAAHTRVAVGYNVQVAVGSSERGRRWEQAAGHLAAPDSDAAFEIGPSLVSNRLMWLPRVDHEQKQDPRSGRSYIDHPRPMTEGVHLANCRGGNALCDLPPVLEQA